MITMNGIINLIYMYIYIVLFYIRLLHPVVVLSVIPSKRDYCVFQFQFRYRFHFYSSSSLNYFWVLYLDIIYLIN